MKDETFNIVITAIVSASSVGGLSAVWWVKRWINSVDTNIKSLTDSVNKLVTADEVQKEKKSQFDGSLTQVQKCLNTTTESLGALSASVTKIWDVIEKIPGLGVNSRTSDNKDN